MQNPSLWIAGGIAGMISIVCYFVAVAISWPATQLGTSAVVIVISGFPVLGIGYSYALQSFVAAERDGAANRAIQEVS